MRLRLAVVGAVAALALALAASPAFAQCAMCQTALINSPEGRGISQEFNRAILVMVFAPYLVLGSVGAVLLRHRIAAALRRSVRRLGAAGRGAIAPAAASQVH